MKQKIRSVAYILLLCCLPAAHAVDVNMPGLDLNGSEWWVEDIEGHGVIDMSHTTLRFSVDGTVSGDTGCNRYHGSVDISGDRIRFGPLAGTRKACSPALMDQEIKFYRAMIQVVSWEIPPTRLLHLKDVDDNTMIRAWRVEASLP